MTLIFGLIMFILGVIFGNDIKALYYKAKQKLIEWRNNKNKQGE